MNNLIIPNVIAELSGTEQAISPFTYELSYRRRIYLIGEINGGSAAGIITQLYTLNDISHDDITLIINSPGGSVSDGNAVIDAINQIECKVSTVCTGVAASMAAIILASGTKGKRFITPRAEVMIHQPLGGVQGQASEISKMCDHILKTKRDLAVFLSERTGKAVDLITNDMDRDYWMTAAEAVNYGIVDAIARKESSNSCLRL